MLDLEKLKLKKRFAWLTDEEKEFLTTTFTWCASLQESVFCLREDIMERPKCNYNNCIEYAIFKPKGYTRGCCKDHNMRLTNLEKYGVENAKQSKEFIDKAKKTYNSKTVEEKAKIQKRKENAMLKKYGVSNPSYSSEIKEKISTKNKANAGSRMIVLKQNNQIKYGVDNVFQLNEIKEKSKETFRAKYGVENPSQSEIIKKQKENTCLKNYGVRNPQQDMEIYEKTNNHRWKNYTMPSGKIVRVQGYEPQALDILLKSYDEAELVLERKLIPKITYGIDDNHQYITDIFIPKENRFIEVKSEYTFLKYLNINLSKEEASIKAGYKFDFMILNKKGDILDRNKIIKNVSV